VSGDNQAETDSYFDTRQFRFHGPDGFEADYSGLANYFKAIRAAFDDRSIRRGIADSRVSSIDFVNAAGLRPQDSTFVGLSNFPSFNCHFSAVRSESGANAISPAAMATASKGPTS
jgi:hypothetical protein